MQADSVEEPLEDIGWVSKLDEGLVGVSGNHQDSANGVIQVNREHIFDTHLDQADWLEVKLHKRTMVSASASVPRKSCSNPYLSCPHSKVSEDSSSP